MRFFWGLMVSEELLAACAGGVPFVRVVDWPALTNIMRFD